MKLVRSVVFVAAATLFTAPMVVDGEQHRRTKNVLKGVPNDPLPFSPVTTKTSMADSHKEPAGVISSFLRRALGNYGGGNGKGGASGGSVSGSASASSASGSSSGSKSSSGSSSADFVDHCLVECENWGGVPAGDRIIPPASIEDWKNSKDSYCCDGGASYLKTKFMAENGQSGLLTFDADIAAKNSTCTVIYDQASNFGKKSGAAMPSSSSSASWEVRFVACDDDCLLEPLGETACDESFDVMHVQNGTEVCFAAVDTSTNHVLFDQKMETNLDVYFILYGNDEDPGALMSVIHTSCSKPLVSPYAVGFHDPCGSFEEDACLLNLDYYFGGIPYLAFMDGISTGYYESAMNAVGDGEDQGSYQQEFDITFENCGCTCDGWVAVDPIFSPTTSPTGCETTDSPTGSPSFSHVSNPSSSPNASPSVSPMEMPSSSPSDAPSTSPSVAPVATPSSSPSDAPSASPSVICSSQPTVEKSAPPTGTPSAFPSASPSGAPVATPAVSPSDSPVAAESNSPTVVESAMPSASPSDSRITRSNAPSSAPSLDVRVQPGPGFPGPPTGECVSDCTDFVWQFCVFGDNAGDLVGQRCDVTQEIIIVSGNGEDDGEDDAGRRLRKFDYHLSRIVAIEKILSEMD